LYIFLDKSTRLFEQLHCLLEQRAFKLELPAFIGTFSLLLEHHSALLEHPTQKKLVRIHVQAFLTLNLFL